MSKNVKRELLKLVKKEDILAAQITIFDYYEVTRYDTEGDEYTEELCTERHIVLKVATTEDQVHQFLEYLDFEYTVDYYNVTLEGTIWIRENKGWLEWRHETRWGEDWEGWVLNKIPELPDSLIT